LTSCGDRILVMREGEWNLLLLFVSFKKRY